MKQTRILALETSHTPGQVALLESGQTTWHESLPTGRRTTETFAMVMQRALRERGWNAKEVDWIAVSRGPGSFTGLRIGITAAKVFAFSTGCGVVSVDTMRLVADQAPGDHDSFWVVLDAQRQQLSVRRFRRDAERQIHAVGGDQIVDGASWLSDRTSSDVLTGSGLERWLSQVQTKAAVVPREFWIPWATTLGQRAHWQIELGEVDDMWSLSPVYHRPSAAEEKASS